jgi:hypothetical protein
MRSCREPFSPVGLEEFADIEAIANVPILSGYTDHISLVRDTIAFHEIEDLKEILVLIVDAHRSWAGDSNMGFVKELARLVAMARNVRSLTIIANGQNHRKDDQAMRRLGLICNALERQKTRA